MAYTTIKLTYESGVATITLNRPDKRNAVSFALVDELMTALDEIERSSAQVVILTGEGKAFCAGLDLDELKVLLGKTPEENIARLVAYGSDFQTDLRLSNADHRRRQWRSHRGRDGICHNVRLHSRGT